jgi:hypothetical protein
MDLWKSQRLRWLFAVSVKCRLIRSAQDGAKLHSRAARSPHTEQSEAVRVCLPDRVGSFCQLAMLSRQKSSSSCGRSRSYTSNADCLSKGARIEYTAFGVAASDGRTLAALTLRLSTKSARHS